MIQFLVRRSLAAIATVFAISVVSFIIIQLPPGDFLTSYMANLAAMGEQVPVETIDAMREAYGLGEPIYVQYLKWMRGVIHGDFGQSMEWGVPVSTLLWDRMGFSVVVGLSSVLFVWVSGDSYRGVLCDAPVLLDGLSVHVYRISGAGDSQISCWPWC